VSFAIGPDGALDYFVTQYIEQPLRKEFGAHIRRVDVNRAMMDDSVEIRVTTGDAEHKSNYRIYMVRFDLEALEQVSYPEQFLADICANNLQTLRQMIRSHMPKVATDASYASKRLDSFYKRYPPDSTAYVKPEEFAQLQKELSTIAEAVALSAEIKHWEEYIAADAAARLASQPKPKPKPHTRWVTIAEEIADDDKK